MKRILILIQLQDFERIKLRGGMKNCFCFFLWRKNNWHLKVAPGSCSLKRVFWGTFFCLEIWGVLDSTKSGHTDKIRCFLMDIDVFWSIIWRRTNSSTLAKWTTKLGILIKIYIFYWDSMVFPRGFCLLPEKMSLFLISLTNSYL